MKVELIITRKVLTEKFSIKSDMGGFFLSFLDGCELKVSDMYPGNIFYIKDGFIFFQQGTATKNFYVRYKMIWFVFEKEYQMAHKEIQEFIKSIIYNYINLNNYQINYANPDAIDLGHVFPLFAAQLRSYSGEFVAGILMRP